MSIQAINLSGKWLIAQDPDNIGRDRRWFLGVPDEVKASPFQVTDRIALRTALWDAYSILFPQYHGFVWYYKYFRLTELPPDRLLLICFEQVDYYCEVWLNGIYVGLHSHSEEPFELDATNAGRASEENLLSIRVFSPVPGCGALEGISADVLPTTAHYKPWVSPWGGIVGGVSAAVVPQVRIQDIYIRTIYTTGEVIILVTLCDGCDMALQERVFVRLFDRWNGHPVGEVSADIRVYPGNNTVSLHHRIPEYKLWSPSSPFLYEAVVSLDNGSARVIRFGFRDLRVIHGFFVLNGKRIFVKSGHTDSRRESVLAMKNCGFNMIRFLTNKPREDVLDLCDELGLMAYCEPRTSWFMKDSPEMPGLIRSYIKNMVCCGRNHASVCVWGLLNEHHGDNEHHNRGVFEECVASLALLRQYDPDRLVILSSGRWDRDRRIGSISNPGSMNWDFEWGADSDESYEAMDLSGEQGGSIRFDSGMGDIHPYSILPFGPKTRRFFRTLGYNTKPVFISEMGFGCSHNFVAEYMRGLQLGHKIDSDRMVVASTMKEALEAFWDKYDLHGIYPYPEDFCTASEKLNCRQREQVFDLIRSNPRICGYSFTSVTVSMEGIWVADDGTYKPGIVNALQDGWAPLRWALFSGERTIYAGKAFEVEAVLCNDGALAPGSYQANACLKGPDGIVWEKNFNAVMPADESGMTPLAVPVMKEEIAGLQAGEYIFAAKLLEGGSPAGGRLALTVIAPKTPKVAETVGLWGIGETMKKTLTDAGIPFACFLTLESAKLVLVGTPCRDDKEGWTKLDELVQNGTNVVFIDSKLFVTFRNEADAHFTALFGTEARCRNLHNGIYHMDYVHRTCPLFEGLGSEGLCDMELYGTIYPTTVYCNMPKPDRTYCAGIGFRVVGSEDNYHLCGLCLGEYAYGAGRLVLNAFRIDEGLGVNPIAEQLLYNLITYYNT